MTESTVQNPRFQSAQRMLVERYRWEERQRRYFQMRHDGLPRLNRTGSWQSDSHSKTIDRAIRKNKPFWLGQLTAGERLCNFVSMQQGQVQAMADAAADYYDFQTYQKSRLIDEIDTCVDHMLLKGKGIIKSTVDPLDEYRIVDTAIDPMFLIIPDSADDFEDADEWIEIRQMTVAEYQRLDSRWDTTEETVKAIRGRKDWQNIGIYNQEVQLREGITHTANANYILIFEHWIKTRGGHTIYYYSPNEPDIQLRKPHGNPYKWQGKESIPYTSFQMEIKDKGWYSPRGLGELLDVQEQKETFVENQWADAMVLANNPPLTGDKELPNTANLRWERNQYIPFNVKPIVTTPPPIPYEGMLQYEKARSEEISMAPDSSSVSPESKTGGKAITATEAKNIAALTQVGSNYNADIFRRRLTRLHQHRWGLMVQFKQKEFVYYSVGSLNTLPEQALHDQYLISPDGSADGWNRGARIQREIGLMQTFAPLPNADKDYWVKRAMAAVDGKAAQQGFVPTGLATQNEYEAQAMEILLLTAQPPFPVQPEPQQDQATRIKCIIDWFEAAHKTGKPVNPQAKRLIQQNLAQRLQILQQQNPAAAKQIKQMLMQAEQATQPPTNGQMPQRNGQVQPQPPMQPPQ